MSKILKLYWPLIVFLLIYTAVIGYKLISHPTPFYDWDESIYMEVGREMVQAKSPFPLWQGEVWLEKPPLAPLVYGLTSALPLQAEISTRVLSLLLAVGALVLIYLWVMRITKNRVVAFLTTFVTALNPLFLHRAQIVNTDVLLLIGWLGYLLFFPRFWLSLLFLALGVYSKSVLGFYPLILLGAYEVYRLLTKRDKPKVILQNLKMMLIQIGLVSIWFVVMYLLFGQEFLKVHFYEHLVRRVTASIESHFGQRTFYLDIIFNQFNALLLILIPSFLLLGKRLLQKKITDQILLMSLFLLPWFIFLNLTKTKISWYVYPVIPQFTFLITYPLTAIKNTKPLLYAMVALFIGFFLYQAVYTNHFSTTYYSSYDAQDKIADYAKSRCANLKILIDADGRKTYEVLKGMNLVISTSTWYGNHPSIVYYFGKKVDFIYDKNSLKSQLSTAHQGQCVVINDEDRDLPLEQNGYTVEQKQQQLVLLQKKN